MVGKHTHPNYHSMLSKTREFTAGSEYGTKNLKSLVQILFLYLNLFAGDMASASKRFMLCRSAGLQCLQPHLSTV